MLPRFESVVLRQERIKIFWRIEILERRDEGCNAKLPQGYGIRRHGPSDCYFTAIAVQNDNA